MTISKYLASFLDLIAWSELGEKLLAKSDNGYNVLVGSTPAKPILFASYADHPRKLVRLQVGNREIPTTAAGRYQILSRIFDHYKKQLRLPDFSPASQDAIAIQLIRERNALKDIESGYIERAIHRCATAWASFPGNAYAQPTHEIEDLLQEFARTLSTRRLNGLGDRTD